MKSPSGWFCAAVQKRKARPSGLANSLRMVGIRAEGGDFFHSGSHHIRTEGPARTTAPDFTTGGMGPYGGAVK